MNEVIKEMNLSMDGTKKSEVIVSSVKHYDDMNKVEMEGTLVGRYDREKFSLLTILTSTGRERQDTSDITVVVSGGLHESAKNYTKGQRIHVTGEVRTRMVGKAAEKEYRTEVYATKIGLAKSGMEEAFGLEGRIHSPSYNKIMLTGTVYRFTQVNRAMAKIVLQIKTGEKPRYVEGVLFAQNIKKLVPQLLVGNRVCMLCEMQSKKKLVDDKPVYRKDLVILDIQEV